VTGAVAKTTGAATGAVNKTVDTAGGVANKGVGAATGTSSSHDRLPTRMDFGGNTSFVEQVLPAWLVNRWKSAEEDFQARERGDS
jgi:hypothetical protein